MKTILIIYGVSWLILLIVYLYSLYQVHHGKSPIQKEPWYLYVIILGLAPLAVLVIPYILISDFLKGKQQRKYNEEKEMREREAKQKRMDAKQNSQMAILLDDESIMNDCQSKSATLINKIDSRNYQDIFTVLDKVSLPSGMTFGVDECEQSGTGDKSKLWVSTADGIKDNEIFKYLIVEDSPSGAWQACLLYKLWHSLPFWWHGAYDCRIYLDNQNDYRKIRPIMRDDDLKMIRNAIKSCKDMNPSISQNGNKYYVQRYYWNDWSGLVRELIEVTIENKLVVSMIEVEKVVEYSYDCGILF